MSKVTIENISFRADIAIKKYSPLLCLQAIFLAFSKKNCVNLDIKTDDVNYHIKFDFPLPLLDIEELARDPYHFRPTYETKTIVLHKDKYIRAKELNEICPCLDLDYALSIMVETDHDYILNKQ